MTPGESDRKVASKLRRYLRFWGPRGEADLDDELRFHVEMRVRDYVARGMSEADARAATADRLGDLIAARQTCVAITSKREQRMTRSNTIDALLQDVRFALRTLGRQKAWTALVVLTLALGIGANTAVFSVVSSLLLHPLPYPNADRLAVIFLEPTKGNQTGMRIMVTVRPEVASGWRASSHLFDAIEPYTTSDAVFRDRGAAPMSVQVARVLPTFPRFAGARPMLGREVSADDIESGANVVMLAEPFWRARFGSDPAILNKAIEVDGKLYTVVGVMPRSLRLPRDDSQNTVDLWLPLDLRDKGAGLSAVGRLRSGATIDAAARELDSISARVNVIGGGVSTQSFHTVLMAPSRLVSFRTSLLLLNGAVGLVLLIACANVAHLLLARSTGRQREFAIRAALGAGRGRILRQLVTESAIVSAVGCAGGLVIGWAGLRLMVAVRPQSLSELTDARLDGTTLALTIGIAALTAILFGLVGARQAARLSTHDTLKAGSLSTSQGRSQGRVRSMLVVSEMALAVVLLVGAGLLVRSIVHLQSMDPGFVSDGLYAIQLPMGSSDSEATARAPRVREFLERARRIPGVAGAALATSAPPDNAFLIGGLEVEGFPPPDKGVTSFLDFNAVSPDFFALTRMQLMSGRTFVDTSSTSTEVIVNAGFAKKYWPGHSALGHRIRIVRLDGGGTWKTVVGVAHDAFTGGLTSEADRPLLYLPKMELNHYLHPALLMRATPGKSPLPAIRSLAAVFDPTQPPPAVIDIGDVMRKSIARPRFTMMLLTIFTAFAVLLAAIGLYGLMAYTVAQRTREIGIRRALGASPQLIAGGVLRQGAWLAGAGAVIGALGSVWATRLVEKMLYGVPRSDPVSFAGGVAFLILIALVACLVPARRALAVDPLIAMRAE